MTPKFAEAVDPLFTYALDLFERLEQGENVDVHAEREGVRKQLDRAEVELAASADWPVAKYAIVVWIDEMLRELLPNNREVIETPLEFEFFQTQDAYYYFYQQAVEAAKLPKKDALETYYLCVVLGFRGLYREEEPGPVAESYGLPPDLATWARRTARGIQTGLGRPTIAEKLSAPEGAPPLTGRYLFAGSVILGGVLSSAIVLLILIWSLPKN